MIERIENFTARNQGCEAMLSDNGNRQIVPVCMGGTALIGCNNPEVCRPLYGDRIEGDGSVHVLFLSEDKSRVEGITTVPRAPLVSREDFLRLNK